MDSSELMSKLNQELKDLASDLTDPDDYTNAFYQAQLETGWVLPISDTFQILWYTERARRWLLFYLWTGSAAKFKVKQLALNQKFDHLGKIIDKLDKAFDKAIEDNPHQFSGVETYKLFGTVAPTGFRYDEAGRDISYES